MNKRKGEVYVSFFLRDVFMNKRKGEVYVLANH